MQFLLRNEMPCGWRDTGLVKRTVIITQEAITLAMKSLFDYWADSALYPLYVLCTQTNEEGKKGARYI